MLSEGVTVVIGSEGRLRCGGGAGGPKYICAVEVLDGVMMEVLRSLFDED